LSNTSGRKNLPEQIREREPHMKICRTATVKEQQREATSQRSRRDVRRQGGQAILELTLVTPFLILLTILTVNYAEWLYAWAQVGNAARAVANYSILGGSASVGSPQTPHAPAIAALIAQDLASLPNYSNGTNPTVAVCWNNNGTPTTIMGTCSSPAADPEPASYTAVSVDLTYTFTPFIAAFDFPSIGVHLPVMPSTIHRRIVMRFI
jgi:Flp pilus assembly protein TadG